MSRSDEGWKKGAMVESRSLTISSIYPGEKVASFYDRQEDMLETAVALMKEAVRRHDLLVMLSRWPAQVTAERLKFNGMDMEAHPNLVIIPWSTIRMDDLSHEGMAEMFGSFTSQATAQGYSGSTLVMDVPEVLAERLPDMEGWFATDRIREEMGISVVCLYDMTTLSAELLVSSLTIYPTVIMQGMLCQNFYCLRRSDGLVKDPSDGLHHQLYFLRAENAQRSMAEAERSRLEDANARLQEEITRRQVVEFALLQSQNNQSKMLDAMADMVFMIDRELRVTMGNRAFIEYLEGHGLDSAFEGRPIFEIFHGLPPENRYLYEEVFQFGYTTVTEESVHLSFGKVEAEVRRVPVFKGEKVDRIVTIFREGSVAESFPGSMWEFAGLLKTAVRDPQGPFGVMLERCPHPVLVHDFSGKIYQFNQAACDMLGYSAQELLDLGMEVLLTDPRELKGHQHRVNRDGLVIIPAMVRHRDGSFTDMTCHLSFTGEGKGYRVITVLHPNG